MNRRIAEVEGFTRQMALNKDLNVLINETATEGTPNTYGMLAILPRIIAVVPKQHSGQQAGWRDETEHFGKNEAIGRNEYDFLYGNISDIITNNKRSSRRGKKSPPYKPTLY